MRSSVLLTSAMAIGAIAGPLNKRWIFTSYEVEVETVTVYVTATAPAPAPIPPKATPNAKEHHDHSRVHLSKSKSTPKSKPVVVPAKSSKVVPVVTSIYTPPPPPPTSVYTPPPVASSKAPAPSAAASNGHLTGDIQGTLSSGPDYQAAVLYHHNAARANHGAAPLVWDDSCTSNAMTAAKFCNFTHYIPEGSGQGQNLFTVSGDSFNVTAGITDSWYKGEFQAMTDNNLWGAEDIPMEIFHTVGHLTQMLWKETTKVGCVSYDCGSKMKVGGNPSDMSKYTVCNYASAGNYGGQYAKNVGLPISYTNLGSWSD